MIKDVTYKHLKGIIDGIDLRNTDRELGRRLRKYYLAYKEDLDLLVPDFTTEKRKKNITDN